jgi:heme-degrading monooxygenase HmoA
MVLEIATLNVNKELTAAFEQAFTEAQSIIASTPGHISHQLQRCVEMPGKYLLLVNWRNIEDHTIGFRQSAGYQQWREKLYHFYSAPPSVEHYETSFEANAQSA